MIFETLNTRYHFQDLGDGAFRLLRRETLSTYESSNVLPEGVIVRFQNPPTVGKCLWGEKENYNKKVFHTSLVQKVIEGPHV